MRSWIEAVVTNQLVTQRGGASHRSRQPTEITQKNVVKPIMNHLQNHQWLV